MEDFDKKFKEGITTQTKNEDNIDKPVKEEPFDEDNIEHKIKDSLSKELQLNNQIIEYLKTLPLNSKNDKITISQLDGFNLAAPQSFWDNESFHYDLVGGCGPGGVGDYFVPDTVWFLKITLACKIHDWCFLVWNNKEDFDKANNIFKNNMMRIIEQKKSSNWVKNIRRRRAWKYFKAVDCFGESSYYDCHKDVLSDLTC